MAREIHEIKSFNAGTVSNADNKDIPDEAAVFSYSIDGNASGGVLAGKRKDTYYSGEGVSAGSSTHYPSGIAITVTIGTSASDLTLTVDDNGYFLPHWYIRIGTEIMKISSQDSTTQLTVQRAMLGTTIANHQANSEIFICILPELIFPMVRDENRKEDLLVFDSSKSRIDLIEDFHNSIGNVVGKELNTAPKFPYKLLWEGKPSIAKGAHSTTISFGKKGKVKWIGYIKGKRFNGVCDDYYIYEARLEPPSDLSRESLFYGANEKNRVVFQAHDSAASGYTATTQLNNTTKALICGLGRGDWNIGGMFGNATEDNATNTNRTIVVINPDNGQSFSSEPFYYDGFEYFPSAIAKCVSTAPGAGNAMKVWVYAHKALDELNTNFVLGKIFLINLANVNGVGAGVIDMGTSGTFDTFGGFTLDFDKVVNVHFATDHTKGYPSEPDFSPTTPVNAQLIGDVAGDGNFSSQMAEADFCEVPAYSDIPSTSIHVRNILETVDNSGNGKLWVQLSNKTGWFHTSTRKESAITYPWMQSALEGITPLNVDCQTNMQNAGFIAGWTDDVTQSPAEHPGQYGSSDYIGLDGLDGTMAWKPFGYNYNMPDLGNYWTGWGLQGDDSLVEDQTHINIGFDNHPNYSGISLQHRRLLENPNEVTMGVETIRSNFVIDSDIYSSHYPNQDEQDWRDYAKWPMQSYIPPGYVTEGLEILEVTYNDPAFPIFDPINHDVAYFQANLDVNAHIIPDTHWTYDDETGDLTIDPNWITEVVWADYPSGEADIDGDGVVDTTLMMSNTLGSYGRGLFTVKFRVYQAPVELPDNAKTRWENIFKHPSQYEANEESKCIGQTVKKRIYIRLFCTSGASNEFLVTNDHRFFLSQQSGSWNYDNDETISDAFNGSSTTFQDGYIFSKKLQALDHPSVTAGQTVPDADSRESYYGDWYYFELTFDSDDKWYRYKGLPVACVDTDTTTYTVNEDEGYSNDFKIGRIANPSTGHLLGWRLFEVGPVITYKPDVSITLEGDKLHRFLFCSYENVDGDWNDGLETDIYLNDKSMPLHTMHRYTNNSSFTHGDLGDFWGYGNGQLFFRTDFNNLQSRNVCLQNWIGNWIEGEPLGLVGVIMQGLQRSVPEDGAAYTEPSLVKTYSQFFQRDSTHHSNGFNHLYVSGGGWWYRDCRTQVQDDSGASKYWKDLPDKSNATFSDDSTVDGVPKFNTTGWLRDVSDVYGVEHTVSCGVNFDKDSKAKIIDDMWLSNPKQQHGQHQSYFSTGVRFQNLSGFYCEWISNGNINNYGANYCRNNGLSIPMGDAFLSSDSDWEQFNDYTQTVSDYGGGFQTHHNLSTLCFDKDKKIVRLFKVHGDESVHNGLIKSSSIVNPQRNCLFPNTSWSGSDSYVDNDPKHYGESSGIYIKKSGDIEGFFTRCTTLPERGATYASLVSGAGSNLSGYAGYNATTIPEIAPENKGRTVTLVVQNGTLADTTYKSPLNMAACLQVPVNTDGSSKNSLVISTIQSSPQINDSTTPDPDTVIPNGPGVIGFFGGNPNHGSPYNQTDNVTFNKLQYNGYTAGSNTIHNLAEYKFFDTGQSERVSETTDNTPAFVCFSGITKILEHDEEPVDIDSEVNTSGGTHTGEDIYFGWPRRWLVKSNEHTDHDITEIAKLGTVEDSVNYMYAMPFLAIGKGGPSASGANQNAIYGKYGYYRALSTGINYAGNINQSIAEEGTEGAISDNEHNFYNVSELYMHFENKYVELNSDYEFSHSFVSGGDNIITEPAGDVDDGGLWEDWNLQGVQSSDTYPFPIGVTRWYKLSYEYDGFQESPLGEQEYAVKNESATTHYKKVNITFWTDRDKISNRVTGITLWRRNDADKFWLKIKKLKISNDADLQYETRTRTDGSSYNAVKGEVTDDWSNQGNYKQVTGVNHTALQTQPSYNCSTTYGSYLFVGNMDWSHLPEDYSSFIWRSKYGNHNQFDPMSSADFLKLQAVPIALETFNNRIYAFTNNSIIQIEPSQLIIENTYRGFGILNKECVIINDYGIFWADKNHIYHHDGTKPKVISYPIERDIYSGASKGWRDLASANLTKAYYDNSTETINFAKTHSGKYYKLSYHLLKSRWDLETTSNEADGAYVITGSLFQSQATNDSYHIKSADSTTGLQYMYTESKGSQTSKFQWWSKEFTMGHDNVDKRFIKIKVTATNTLSTPTIEIDGVVQTLISIGATSGEGVYEWKINSKGKKLQIKWGNSLTTSAQMKNDNCTVSSIGIVYRRTKVK